MHLHAIDLGIIALYLAATIFIGFYISKRASRGLDSYFLGDRGMPWYILGVSNASGMFDITGTMWLVYILFVYGLKSVFLPWVWPVFNQIFLMVYLSAWLRRSNVMTGAEWITLRFGKGKGATLSHLSVVAFALISVVGFLAYDFKGIGKFATQFLPWDLTNVIPGISSANMYAFIFMGITALYVISGGMFSVVFTEVLQFLIMTVASIAVGVIAMAKVSPQMLERVLPAGWKNIFFGMHLDLDWTGILNSANSKIASDGYSLFGFVFMMLIFKGFLVSMAGPAPNYDMQRILATRSPKEASMMSWFVNIVLFIPRYMMIAGVTVLALGYFLPELRAMGENVDFEMVLPYAVSRFIPIGLLGLLLAGLISAFMSTFAATVNAAPAYIVNDIYKRYINPTADDKRLVFLSKAASLAVVVVGMGFGLIVESINSVTLMIVNALWGGYAAANVLKWYWWRFNGYGYFWGMVSGILTAAIFYAFDPNMAPIKSLSIFPAILAVSMFFCVIASLLSKPDPDEVLKEFYRRVRPWGFWKPIHDKVVAEHPEFKKNTNFGRDWVNIFVGIIWQTSLVAFPIFLIIREWSSLIITILVIALTSFALKKNWYDKLEED
ncbi:MAG: Na+:solute symporter [candidate division KSB1 bacterium]|nr:Na+:solute symporter [candidate division KSB1 bacterium]MDZ7346131.1 Na+:solute symporter [candidate division KSB1 bacterium]